MANSVLFLSAILLPVVVITILKVDAAVVFLSLCLGSVLVQFLSGDAVSFITTFYPHASSYSLDTMKIFLLFLPVVLTVIVMFHSIKGHKILLNLLPAIGVGALGVLLVQPLLSQGLRNSLEASSLWQHFNQAQTLIVGASSLLALLFLWMGRKGGRAKDSKNHSKG